MKPSLRLLVPILCALALALAHAHGSAQAAIEMMGVAPAPGAGQAVGLLFGAGMLLLFSRRRRQR